VSAKRRPAKAMFSLSPVQFRNSPIAGRGVFSRTRFEPGEVIVRQGERTDRFYIVVEGQVEVRREGHGQDVVVTRHEAGHLFGEVGALTGAAQTATYVALDQVMVMAIDRTAFQDIASQSASADLRERVRSTLSGLGTPAPGNQSPGG